MEILFLGTGHAISPRCYNTCYVLRQNERYLLVDGGGGNGILRQLQRARLPWQKIKDIFVTHRHMDHVLGVFWLIRMIVKAMKRGTYVGEARIYGHEEVIQQLCCWIQGIWDSWIPGSISSRWKTGRPGRSGAGM